MRARYYIIISIGSDLGVSMSTQTFHFPNHRMGMRLYFFMASPSTSDKLKPVVLSWYFKAGSQNANKSICRVSLLICLYNNFSQSIQT